MNAPIAAGTAHHANALFAAPRITRNSAMKPAVPGSPSDDKQPSVKKAAMPGITRASLGPDVIGGYRIPTKASVTLLTWNAHYDPRFWDAPDAFDPERFTPERSANRPAFAYLPFGAGPRQCIGNIFALSEAQLVLASMAQRYQLRLKAGHPVTPRPIFVLRTSHGLPMTAHRRQV